METTNPEEILADPFVRSKRIETIEITGYARADDKTQRHVSIVLGGWRGVVHVQLSGPFAECVEARRQIEELIGTSALWYAHYRWLPGLTTFGNTTTAAALGLFCTLAGARWLSPTLAAIAAAGFFLLFQTVLTASRGFLFPRLVFEIGKTKGIAEAVAFRRRTVVTVVVLGLAVSIIASLIVNVFWPSAGP